MSGQREAADEPSGRPVTAQEAIAETLWEHRPWYMHECWHCTCGAVWRAVNVERSQAHVAAAVVEAVRALPAARVTLAADSEQSDLRSRLAAAEARAEEFRTNRDWWKKSALELAADCGEAEAETERLRAGIQALADDPPHKGEPMFRHVAYVPVSSLRSLLSPANPQKDEQP